MAFKAEVVLDSVSPSGHRLTTISATFPRFILADMNTHRAFSRCTVSVRCTPIERMIEAVKEDPFVPETWPINTTTAHSAGSVALLDGIYAEQQWRASIADAISGATQLAALGVHKQIVNRLLEPFAWTTQLITATEWVGFLRYRCRPGEQPEMQTIARTIKNALDGSTPTRLNYGEWHTPFANDCVLDAVTRKYISVARCSQIVQNRSASLHDIEKDLLLFERLHNAGKWSAFEHVATPLSASKPSLRGNLRGWHQFRKYVDKK